MTSPAINNPFVGLRPFESDEDFLFFGREEQSLELLQRLHQHHFVAVIGSSGSGKSSLIKAGLIPGLEAGYLVNDRDRWLIASMKPGDDPLCNLAGAILGQLQDPTSNLTAKDLVEKINEEGVDALLAILKPLITQKVNFFLLVDQFEELFRFSLDQKSVEKKDEATDFVNILLELSEQIELPVYVVITMRSDFIGDCTRFFGLPEALNKSQYLVPRLNRTQLKTTIEGPVQLFKGKINPGLTARLLNDAQLVKDELPLLQHALMRTWDYEVNIDKSGELDINDYEKIGGIEKALSNHADEALVGMSDRELLLTKKIFQALTTVDENGRKVRRPARLSELEAISGAGKEEILSLINRFIEGNRSFLIINKSGDGNDWLIDISHESLIRQWSALSSWVDEESESAKIYERIIESSSLYADKKKDLMTGSELQLALQWYKTFKPLPVWAQRYNPAFDESIHYLNESEKESEAGKRRKKARKRNQLLLACAFIAFVITALAFYSKDKAKQAEIANSLKDSALHASTIAEQQTALALTSQHNAEIQKANADSSAAEARRQTLAATLARNDAVKQRNAAVEAKRIALAAQLDAYNSAEIAKNERRQTEVQKEGFRLILVARQQVNKDPTVALRIAEEAYKKYPDSLILREAKQIYEENAFYKTVLKDSSAFSTLNTSIDGTKVLTTSSKAIEGSYLGYAFQANVLNFKEKNPITFRDTGYLITAFSPDGNKIITASNDSLVLWNIDGKKIQSMKGPSNINMIALSNNDSNILTTDGYSASLWNMHGNVSAAFNNNEYIRSIGFSPDGSKVLTASDSTFTLWSLDGKSSQQFNPHHLIYQPAFSSNGTNIITSVTVTDQVKGTDSTKIELWDLKNNKGRILNHPGNISTAIFSPDGAKVLTGSSNNTIRLWNIEDSSYSTEFKGLTSPATSLAFSSDGTKILSGSEDGTAKMWSIDGTLITILKGHNVPITYVAFSPEESKYYTGAPEDGVRVWNTSIDNFTGHTGEINLVAFSHDNTKILTGSLDHTARLWNMQGDSLKTFVYNDQVASVTFSDDGKILIASGDSAYLLNKDYSIEKKFPHSGLVQSVAFSKDGKSILTGSDDSTAVVWNIAGNEINKFRDSDGIAAVAFSPDGTKVLTGSRDSTAKLWDINDRTNHALKVFRHSGTVYSVAFSKDGNMLTGSADSTAKLWSIYGIPISTFKHNGEIESVAFSPDGTKVMTGSHDFTASLWKTNGTLIKTFSIPASVRTVAFSPDGKKIFIGATDGIGRLYSTITLEEFLQNNEIDTLTPEQKEQIKIK